MQNELNLIRKENTTQKDSHSCVTIPTLQKSYQIKIVSEMIAENLKFRIENAFEERRQTSVRPMPNPESWCVVDVGDPTGACGAAGGNAWRCRRA